MRLDDPKFNNKHCKACIKRNIAKYGSFDVLCDGITVEQDVKFAMKNGMDEETARWLYDSVYFFGKVYGQPAREYQKPILLCTARRMVGRQCRQTGKTLSITQKLVKFAVTNEKKTVLILAPTEKQIKKIWDEYLFRDCIDQCPEIKASVIGASQKPYYNVKFDNGSSILLMIANEGARGQTADIIYIDEAAIIGADMLNSIMMTIASKGPEAVIYLTSTPKGRGNYFFRACKEFKNYQEFHITIDDVEIMRDQREEYRELLGEDGYGQECMAEFPDGAGGPFSYAGIDLAKVEYDYKNCVKEPGMLYFGGVDWNGPNVGSHFYVVGFDPDSLRMKVVDKQVIASATWNSISAKNMLIDLNRKWNCKAWMCDYGYGHTIIEEIRMMSVKAGNGLHPDQMLKHIIEAVEFGASLILEDQFTKEEVKKTQRAFIVSQVSRLFEVHNNAVPISFSKKDADLIKSLESYKLLTVTDKGVEKFGFDKDAGIEDHLIDAFCLAIYGIVKNYSELFKKVILHAKLMLGRNILAPPEEKDERIIYGGSIVLLTDSSPEPIHLDARKIKDPSEAQADIIISRSITKSGIKRSFGGTNISNVIRSRGGYIKRTNGF
jgi:replicative DNA helicase